MTSKKTTNSPVDAFADFDGMNVDEIFNRGFEDISKFNLLPFDGICGYPPKWISPADECMFIHIRQKLLAKYSLRVIQEWVGAAEKARKYSTSIKNVDLGVVEDIRWLADLKHNTALPRDECVEVLGGPYAMRGLEAQKQCENASKGPRKISHSKAKQYKEIRREFERFKKEEVYFSGLVPYNHMIKWCKQQNELHGLQGREGYPESRDRIKYILNKAKNTRRAPSKKNN